MAIFVINEWLWADLSGGNGLPAQREGFRVVEKLPASNHRIVVIEGSPFDQKAWSLCKGRNPIVQRVAGAILVTTDAPLREAAGKANLDCLSREQFLSTFF